MDVDMDMRWNENKMFAESAGFFFEMKSASHPHAFLAAVSLISSWLSSVTNVSLPSSSPGEEGGVF